MRKWAHGREGASGKKEASEAGARPFSIPLGTIERMNADSLRVETRPVFAGTTNRNLNGQMESITAVSMHVTPLRKL